MIAGREISCYVNWKENFAVLILTTRSFIKCRQKIKDEVRQDNQIQIQSAVFKWLRRWIPNPGVPCSKPLGGSKVDSAIHPSEVDKMSTRDFWELSGKK